MKTITWLSPQDAPEWFPPLEQALEEPSGLLAAGGDLSPARLIAAYDREHLDRLVAAEGWERAVPIDPG